MKKTFHSFISNISSFYSGLFIMASSICTFSIAKYYTTKSFVEYLKFNSSDIIIRILPFSSGRELLEMVALGYIEGKCGKFTPYYVVHIFDVLGLIFRLFCFCRVFWWVCKALPFIIFIHLIWMIRSYWFPWFSFVSCWWLYIIRCLDGNLILRTRKLYSRFSSYPSYMVAIQYADVSIAKIKLTWCRFYTYILPLHFISFWRFCFSFRWR